MLFPKSNQDSFLLQKTSNEAVILGGGILQKSILTLDLTTGAYKPAIHQLSKDRYRPACAQGSQGEFYIAGGYGLAKGMEVWYPSTGQVSSVSSELPPEVGSTGTVLYNFFCFSHQRQFYTL